MCRFLVALVALALSAAAQEEPIQEVDPLLELPGGARVVHGTDPGDFYCEHAFFTSTTEALRPGSGILRNGHGEPLVGFLHVPHDVYTYDAALRPDQAARHADRRAIVGAALRGFRLQAVGHPAGEPFRVLLTGYAQWGSVVNNPSGDFVTHAENVEAAMECAFGGALGGGAIVETQAGRLRLEFAVRGEAGEATPFVVVAARLPVTDAAIDGSPGSLQALIADVKPHAVLSLGVAGDPPYRAEFHADDGCLVVEDDRMRHDDEHASTRSHPDNFALARALRAR